jgi:hypothetical protein
MAATQTEVIRAEECALCAELETWCGVQGLPFISADDLRRREDITTAAQRDWLEDYCARWDAWETRAADAAEAAEASPSICVDLAPVFALQAATLRARQRTADNCIGTCVRGGLIQLCRIKVENIGAPVALAEAVKLLDELT